MSLQRAGSPLSSRRRAGAVLLMSGGGGSPWRAGSHPEDTHWAGLERGNFNEKSVNKAAAFAREASFETQ